jgi:hypothetical protein
MPIVPLDYIEIAHRLPGRLRVRVPTLRKRRAEAEQVAGRIAGLDGVLEVEGHPFTGSLLVRFDPARADEGRILDALREATGVRLVVAPGEPRPAPRVVPGGPASAVGRATVQAFRSLDDDILRVTGGGMDLGVLATLGFLAVGALEVAVTRKLPAPPWFNLAWMGFRTFMTVEAAAVREGGGDAQADPEPGAG